MTYTTLVDLELSKDYTGRFKDTLNSRSIGTKGINDNIELVSFKLMEIISIYNLLNAEWHNLCNTHFLLPV